MNDKKILKYVKCCVNLYFIVSIQEIIHTIKHYEESVPTRKEVQRVLENFITPRTYIQLKYNLAYNKKYVKVYNIMSLHKTLEMKPFYYPEYIDSLFKYESSSYYEETSGYGFLFELFYEANNDYADPAEIAHCDMDWIGSVSRIGMKPNEILKEILNSPIYKAYFSDKTQRDQLLRILNTIHRNARTYHNKGFTLNELEM